jgi:LmbE family N-acetylglucosaminyl deacetylase
MKGNRSSRSNSANKQKAIEIIQPTQRERQLKSDFSLLACYAHPDDEQGISGTLAYYADQGVRTGLLCATRGELGEIADPALATTATLGQVREQELQRALAVLHLHHLWFLNYLDSGMQGDGGNRDPRAFLNADEQEALGKIVGIIRAFQPTAIITFDASGGYGHPDHLRIHDLTTKAFVAAQDPAAFPEAGRAWQTSRLFYASLPRSNIRQLAHVATEAGLGTNFDGMHLDQLGIPDEQITHQIDVRAYVENKRTSLLQHRTQLKSEKTPLRAPVPVFEKGAEYHAMLAGFPLKSLTQPEGIFPTSVPRRHAHQHPGISAPHIQANGNASWGAVEHFVLAAGVQIPDTTSATESDLFAGLHKPAKTDDDALGRINQESDRMLSIRR